MVRKSTLVLLVVLAALVGLVYYLRENPLPSEASQTPSPTAPSQLLSGINSSSITGILYQDTQAGLNLTMTRDSSGAWQVTGGANPSPDAGLMEQLRAEIASMRVVSVLPEGSDPADYGLTTPARTITVQTSAAEPFILVVGKETSVQSGTFLRVNHQTPVVVNTGALDSIASLAEQIAAPPPAETPSPDGSVTPVP
jgi:hypothetical protein